MAVINYDDRMGGDGGGFSIGSTYDPDNNSGVNGGASTKVTTDTGTAPPPVGGGLSSTLISRGDPSGGSAQSNAGTGGQGGSTASAAGASFDVNGWVNGQLQTAQSTDDPNYWYGKISSDPNVQNPTTRASALNYWAGRIAQGNGAAAVKNGTTSVFQDGPAAGAPAPGGDASSISGYTDPDSLLYLNQVLQRLQQVQTPQDPTILNLLNQLATQRVTQLGQAPYTDAQSRALITQMQDPLTQARDTAKAQEAQDLSRRGITPSSGVYDDEMNKIDQSYVSGVAKGTNTLAVNGIAQANTNAQQQLQILSSLIGVNNTAADRSNAMNDEAVSLAKMFPDFDATRLSQLEGASSDTGSSALQSLLSLAGINLNTLNSSNAADAANAAAWAKFFSSIPGLIPGL